MDLFIKDEIKEIKIGDNLFKYRPITSGDELDWLEDYTERYTEIIDGKERIKFKANYGKQAICKFRNIIEVPLSTEELKSITGINKKFSEYNNKDKDLLFRKMQRNVYDELVKQIDKINEHQKKD